MAIDLNDNTRVLAPKPTDPRFFADDNTPWASIEAVEEGIPLTERHPELPVDVMGVIYWWKDGEWVVKNPKIYVYDFVSTENQQEFVIPEGFTVNSVFLNRTFLIKSEYTYNNQTLTILEPLETGTLISTR